jgi:hypothetical protein
MNKWWKRILELCSLARREMLQTGQRWRPCKRGICTQCPDIQ